MSLIHWEKAMMEWIVPPVRDTFPGDSAAIVVRTAEGDRLLEGHFSLVPKWRPDNKWSRANTFNARSETIFEKPTFKGPILRSRCIVPVTGFYEQAEKRWLRYRGSRDPLLLAGIYEPEHAGCPLPSFSLVTCESSAQLMPVNDRMPVVLSEEEMDRWLDPSSSRETLSQLFRPWPEEFSVEDMGSTLRRKQPPAAIASLFDL